MNPTMPGEEHWRKLERMYDSSPLNAFIRPRMTVGEGTAEVVIPVRSELFHAAGAIHGSIYFKALDDSAFFAVSSLVEEFFVLTASFTLYLLRPVSEGELRARGRVIHRSSRLFVAESEATDAAGRLVARGSGTFMRSRTPLTSDIGYA